MRTQSSSFSQWRNRIFSAAWMLYAGYYICRKDIAPASAETGDSHLAISLACFGATYAIGQLAGGALADRYGARRTALAGAFISIVCTSLLAWCAHPMIGLGLLLQLGNGLGQGFGWPALLKLLGGWFRCNERDTVLGWWSTSYILGGLLATSLTAWLIVHTGVVARNGFHPAYLVSSGVLLCATLIFFRETSGLPQFAPATAASRSQEPSQGWGSITANRNIRLISGMYFFLKMTRYTLLFWLPHYLITSLGHSVGAAEHIASYFELFGFLGPLAAGYAVQRWFAGRHMALGAGMLFGLSFLCLLHPVLASSGWFAMTISISLMGVLIYGADVLMSGMAVLDAVPEDLHGRAAGFVNGVGSLGQMISPFLVTIFVSRFGWNKLFDLFVFFALVAGAICAFGSSPTGQTHGPNRSALEASGLPL